MTSSGEVLLMDEMMVPASSDISAIAELVRILRAKGRRWIVITGEGVIGAGKSTMLKNLQRTIERTYGGRVVVVPEPVDEVKAIREQFYANPAKYGYVFQTTIFVARVKAFGTLLRELKAREAEMGPDAYPTIFLQDRSSISDILFVDNLHQGGLMNEIEYTAFNESWYPFWLSMLFDELQAAPDIIMYLRTPLDACMKRITVRNRHEETGIPLTYQEDLERLHDKRYAGDLVQIAGRNIPCIRLSDLDTGISTAKLHDLWTRIVGILIRPQSLGDSG